MHQQRPAVYIMSNHYCGKLYVDVTDNLLSSVSQHKNGLKKSLMKRRHYKNLVYYELHNTMLTAKIRKKQLKLSSRKNKAVLIQKMNPYWDDLYLTLL